MIMLCGNPIQASHSEIQIVIALYILLARRWNQLRSLRKLKTLCRHVCRLNLSEEKNGRVLTFTPQTFLDSSAFHVIEVDLM